MGGERRSIREKMADLLFGRPTLHFEPKHRVSGPCETPSDWWNRPELVMPQCVLCHERVLPGSEPLTRGLCGPCRDRTSNTPEAA